MKVILNKSMILLKCLITILLLITIICNSYSQNKPSPLIKCPQVENTQDCKSAIMITPMEIIRFHCTPEGYGENLEIANNNKKSLFFFEKENNIMWLKFNCSKSAEMIITIKPHDISYDYDFMLFKDTTDFCKTIIEKNYLPLRSNLSRNDTNQQSITGLSILAQDNFIHSGPGKVFSKSLYVKKGERYYLVIDNVYGGTKGFNLYFDFYHSKKISGKVVAEESGDPVQSEVSWEDVKTGKVLAKTVTDSIGNYNFDIKYSLVKNTAYLLSAFNEKYFISDTVIPLKAIKEKEFKSIRIKLPDIIKGGRARFNNINFYGGQAIPLPSSKNGLKKLKKIMRKNMSLSILVEGHTNGEGESKSVVQKLSLERAQTIKSFLIKNGVNESRIKVKGFGSTRMLYPKMETDWQQSLNRRVEIFVTNY